MSRRRRGPAGLPRCRDCGARVTFLRSPRTGAWRPFQPHPIDPGAYGGGTPAYPVEGVRAWVFAELVEDLMVRQDLTRAEAQSEAYDMPWHAVHDCRERDDRKEGQW